MKIKFAFPAMVFLVAMTMATGAFAQTVFTLSSGIEPRGRMNGHAELAGGITMSRFSGNIAECGDWNGDYRLRCPDHKYCLLLLAPNAITVRICNDYAPRG